MVSIYIPRGIVTGKVACGLKKLCPCEFKDVKPAQIQLFGAVQHGKYIQKDSFELSLLPDFLEAGDYRVVKSILTRWLSLRLDRNWNSQLPPAAGVGNDHVHVVAVIPAVKIVCLAVYTVFTMSLNESSLVKELKEELKNQLPEGIKLVEAKCGNYQLKCEDVAGRRTSEVERMIQTLAARDEMDLSLSVKAAFPSATSRSTIDVIVIVV
ncbi:hypothetical protein P3T76_011675 [Phytophthora citrophthora]|uniref:Uncharacterized protein n=1 Tax=Phytophthora citrophthora TaxID=4793 RepID=A0AAD9G8X4_9STRA|nr:hypothetical protein P3T76_011675 [Phytophthora citrophthora]